ncbi:MAG: PP2C family protein-serine/threonine phosphatase [Planctomycetes bacterium]|nr:PP2C family protein-serine/threonine phosphatase [Planctomycetota bacterium]MCB9919974.1 PP2C family protein-serine/threonine phosphatase [Planctomycetota bacterium]
MIGAGTQDLARVLVELSSRLVSGPSRPALRIFDASGRELAAGGRTEADGEPQFSFEDANLVVRDLVKSRSCEVRPVRLRECVELWVVATDEATLPRSELADFAELVSGMLERERLRDYEAEDTTEHLLTCFEQIRAMHDLSDRLPMCETVEAMVELCLESLNTALGVRSSVLVLRDRPPAVGRVLRLSTDGEPATISEYEPVSGPLADALVDAKVRYGTVSSYEIAPGSLESEAEHSLMVVPVCFGSERDSVLGALLVFDRDDIGPGRAFGSPDADLAQSVGTLLGLALGTRARAEAEKELQIARTIQETLIPANAPSWGSLDVAGRNRSANQVGGDYFDFVESAAGQQHCIIADVSGHNMASAMAMVMARSQLRAVLRHEASPSGALEELCRGMHEDLVRNELFITAFFLTVVERDPARGARIRYASAGHNPPLVLRRDGSIEWLHGGGPMIGFMPEISYEESELWLADGDLLVLYTDGVTEATDARGKMLDEEGLAGIVQKLQRESAGQILDGIYRRVDAHSDHRAADDDVTVVVIKCRVDHVEPCAAAAGIGSKE